MQYDPFSDFNPAAEVERISQFIRDSLRGDLRRRGAVVAISGGVDSSVCAALCVAALGAERVFGVLLPERESSAESLELGLAVSEQLGISHRVQNITSTLEALECYATRDRAIAELIPGFGAGWRQKVVIMGGIAGRFNYFKLIAEDPNGALHETRLALEQYLSIVAATNYKQRVRKSIEYFHADRLNYAVIGTPNRLEYDQGFFVKGGDGAADIKPIAHLYKTQVYALAKALELPGEITSARPTTDTYSLAQGQDEFYFALPYEQMDLALWAHNHGVSAADLAPVIGLTPEHAQRIYVDIQAKRRATAYLHSPPILADDVPEIEV